MQIGVSEPAVSVLKKKVPGSKGQFSRMHLAVYPFQVEFLTNIEYKTYFQFQKNFQIIGQTKDLIPRCQKGSKYQLKDPMNLIYFKLFSSTNVVYKWSVYMKHTNGEEEYLESCTLNLKQVVYNFIIPQKSVGSHSNNSLIQLGFNAKQMRLKFPKTGVILMFLLFVSDDIQKIKDYIDEKMFKKSEEHIIFGIPSLDSLNYDDFNFGVSNKKYQNPPNSLQDLQKKKSLSRIKRNQSLLLDSKQKSITKKNPQDNKNVVDSNYELGNLIMSFDIKDANRNKVQQFVIQIKQQNKEENVEEQNKEQQVEKKHQAMEFGMLKLQSDQGRLNQDQIDKRLQIEELQAIDQERTSKGDAPQSQNLTPLKPKKRFQTKKASNETNEQFEVQQKKFNMRKLLLITLLSLFLFLVGVGLSKNIKKGKSNRK